MPFPHATVLVIGAGPAGSSAARVAAEQGLEVILIERRPRIGVPVQCAEYIPAGLGRHAKGEGVRHQWVDAMRTHLCRQSSIRTDVPGLLIDRARFDQGLADEAARAGARILTASSLLALDAARRLATVRQNGRTLCLGYDYLVAADGPRSRVAQSIGLAPLQCLYSYQYRVPLRRRMDDTEVWQDSRFPGGYAWLFPCGDEANLGVAGFSEAAPSLKTGLRELHRELRARGRLGEGILRHSAGPIPVSGLRQPLVYDRHLFVGDAGGFCHPITGAGIAMAVDSGCAAGEAIAAQAQGQEVQALSEYEREMRLRYGASLGHAVGRRQQLLGQWREHTSPSAACLRQSWIAYPEYFHRSAHAGTK